jgi:hypothetical protein
MNPFGLVFCYAIEMILVFLGHDCQSVVSATKGAILPERSQNEPPRCERIDLNRL